MKFKTFNAGSTDSPSTTPTSEVADTNTIDRVMRLDPERMSDQDLDVIIGYFRKARGLFEAGVKPQKGFNAAGEKIDLSASLAALIGKPPAPPSAGIKRRV